MKYMAQLFLVIAAGLCVIGCATEKNHRVGSVTIGEDLEGWACYLADPNVSVRDVWRVKDGIIVCSGEPLGYLYTEKDFGDFVLKLEWRWPPEGEAGKGGVLIRMTGKHKVWPKSLEAQINAGGAGDFWGLDGYELSGPAERMRSLEHEEFGKLTNLKKIKALEKPAGQWNSYEIIARGDTVTLIINGEQVNKAAGCALDPGKICLTSEGSEIHFRNVSVTAIP